MTDATQRLLDLVRREVEDCEVLDVEAVRQCVVEGEDVMYAPDREDSVPHPPLRAHAARGNVTAFLASLHTTLDVDFAHAEHGGDTPLHDIARSWSTTSAESATEMLAAVVRHIEGHPNDKVDWGQENDAGEDFLNIAAENHCLHQLYPVVKGMPYFADRSDPIPLRVVWRYDFNLLSDEEKQDVDISSAEVYEAREATARLCDICQSPDWGISVNITALEASLADGADVMFRALPQGSPLLSALLLNGEWEAVLSCLRCSSRPIDFSAMDEGWSFLHHLAWLAPSGTLWGGPRDAPPDHMARILHAVIDHVAVHGEASRVDWGATTPSGAVCISCAAASGRLSEWWGVVSSRGVEYYVDHAEPIEITEKVRREDWGHIPAAERGRLRLRDGFQE